MNDDCHLVGNYFPPLFSLSFVVVVKRGRPGDAQKLTQFAKKKKNWEQQQRQQQQESFLASLLHM